jgi:biopolymer transport protein ExbD
VQTATASQIGSIWRQEFASNANLIAAVKTHPDASYRHMIDVLDQLQAAQADKISLQILDE